MTAIERESVLSRLAEGIRDESSFSWVKCPVWRLRLHEISKTGVISEHMLSLIFKYVLEGDRNASEILVPATGSDIDQMVSSQYFPPANKPVLENSP